MSPRVWLVLGSLLAALAVAAGAYGAHGLQAAVSKQLTSGSSDTPLSEDSRQELTKRLGYWEVAARYQMYHAIGILLVGLIASSRASKAATCAGICMLLGILLFCGLLDVMTFGGPKWLGAIVPIGGLSMIVGWLALARAAW